MPFFKEQRGSAYVVFWAFMLPILLGMIGLGADISRVQAVATKLQTAADAAALAATTTATPVYSYVLVAQYDADGDIVGYKRQVTGAYYEITDAARAQKAADAAFNLNMQNMVHDQGVTITSKSGRVYSRRTEDVPADKDSYTYRAGARIETFYLGPAMKLIDPKGTGYSEFPVGVVGTASIGQPRR